MKTFSSDDAFDLNEGVLTFNIPGTYKLTFSGQSSFVRHEKTYIKVKWNTMDDFIIADGNNADTGDRNNISYVWLMQLEEGDTLELYSYDFLFVGGSWPLTFTGELILKQ